MKNINYFFFDCFEVVFGGIITEWIKTHFDPQTTSELINGPLVKLDRGEIQSADLLALLSEKSGIKTEQIEKDFHDLVVPMKEMITFIGELSKEHSVYLLSNAAKDHLYEVLSTEPQLFTNFKHIYVSSEMHIAKPSVEFFEYVIKDLGADPTKCLFVDDNKKNIDSAASLGINTILYKGFDLFKKEVEQYL